MAVLTIFSLELLVAFEESKYLVPLSRQIFEDFLFSIYSHLLAFTLACYPVLSLVSIRRLHIIIIVVHSTHWLFNAHGLATGVVSVTIKRDSILRDDDVALVGGTCGGCSLIYGLDRHQLSFVTVV